MNEEFRQGIRWWLFSALQNLLVQLGMEPLGAGGSTSKSAGSYVYWLKTGFRMLMTALEQFLLMAWAFCSMLAVFWKKASYEELCKRKSQDSLPSRFKRDDIDPPTPDGSCIYATFEKSNIKSFSSNVSLIFSSRPFSSICFMTFRGKDIIKVPFIIC